MPVSCPIPQCLFDRSTRRGLGLCFAVLAVTSPRINSPSPRQEGVRWPSSLSAIEFRSGRVRPCSVHVRDVAFHTLRPGRMPRDDYCGQPDDRSRSCKRARDFRTLVTTAPVGGSGATVREDRPFSALSPWTTGGMDHCQEQTSKSTR